MHYFLFRAPTHPYTLSYATMANTPLSSFLTNMLYESMLFPSDVRIISDNASSTPFSISTSVSPLFLSSDSYSLDGSFILKSPTPTTFIHNKNQSRWETGCSPANASASTAVTGSSSKKTFSTSISSSRWESGSSSTTPHPEHQHPTSHSGVSSLLQKMQIRNDSSTSLFKAANLARLEEKNSMSSFCSMDVSSSRPIPPPEPQQEYTCIAGYLHNDRHRHDNHHDHRHEQQGTTAGEKL
jgi:hypothetical protein